MKRKYFLRGLGAGIVLSAVVCSAAVVQNKMSDEQIRARARMLGMVEKTTAPKMDLVQNNTEKPEATKSAKETKESKTTETPGKGMDMTDKPFVPGNNSTFSQKATKQPIATKQPVSTQKPATDKTGTTPKYISVNIEAGMWSKQICQKFQELGLVDDAEKFDDYLCDEGYASLIHIGKYQIPVGATYEQIAKIITK